MIFMIKKKKHSSGRLEISAFSWEREMGKKRESLTFLS